MSDYPGTVASLPSVTNRSKFTATLANTWLEEAVALQADYASTIAGFSTLASLFNVNRDAVGQFKEHVIGHANIASVVASQHHTKLHAPTHVNGADDIRNSDEYPTYQKGLMSPAQAARVNSSATQATVDITGVGSYIGTGGYESQSIELGTRPIFVRIISAGSKTGRLIDGLNRMYKESRHLHSRVVGGIIHNSGFTVFQKYNISQTKYYYFYIGRSVGWEPSNYTWLDLQDQYYAVAADDTVHDITTEDLGIAAWVKIPGDASRRPLSILHKTENDVAGAGYCFGADGYHDLLVFSIQDGDTDTYTRWALNVGIIDDNWHHVAVTVDKSNEDNCVFFVDGLRVETVTEFKGAESGTLADVGSLTNNGTLRLGRFSVDGMSSTYFDGQIREIILTYPADIMATGEMGAAGEIFNLANTFFEKDSYCNYEDYWACNDGAGLTIAGVNNDLTLDDDHAWFLR